MKSLRILVATLLMGLLINAAPTASATATPCGTHHKAKTTSVKKASLKKSSLRKTTMYPTTSSYYDPNTLMNANIGASTPGLGLDANAGLNVGPIGVNGNIGTSVNPSTGLSANAGINTPLMGANAGLNLGSSSYSSINGVGFSVPRNELGWMHVTPFWDLPVRFDTIGEVQDWSYLSQPDYYEYGTNGPVLQGSATIGSPSGITPMASTSITIERPTLGSRVSTFATNTAKAVRKTTKKISDQVKRSTFELSHGGRTR